MNSDQEYLRYLLEKREWTIEEQEWMLNYLEGYELSDLEALAAEEFKKDVVAGKGIEHTGLAKEVLKKIHQRVKAPKPSFWQVIQLHRVRYSIAACIILVAGLGYLFSKVLNTHSGQQVLTAANERKTVTLPDGSLVSMEPGTVLEYPEQFRGKTREVRLKGEAFFEITKDAAHPFIIHAQQINAMVLGTSFNVAAYALKDPSVVVVTGRVKVQTEAKGKQAVILYPNQSVVYHSNTNELQKQEAVDDAVYCRQRREGKFIYKGVALQKVVEDLQRFYNTTIVLEEGIKNCSFYGDFFTGDQLDKALNIIAYSLNATIKKDNINKRYTIVGGGCQ